MAAVRTVLDADEQAIARARIRARATSRRLRRGLIDRDLADEVRRLADDLGRACDALDRLAGRSPAELRNRLAAVLLDALGDRM